MTLYETIFLRRSVRKFDMTPLDEKLINDIRKVVEETKQLDGQKARFEFVTSSDVKNSAAPHYILAYCEENDSSYANVGYVLQKADLFIQSIGLGSVWLGMAKPNKQEQDYCILLAFGKTDVPVRKNIGAFSRLSINEISNEDNAIAAAARLAPSAVNTQPWKLQFGDGKVTIQYFGRGLMKLLLKKKINKIDIGIVTRHVEIALLHEQKAIKSITPKNDGTHFSIEIMYV
jgi:hypothetical protein